MAIVARGLGLPEDGSLVAAGLGTTEADPNAMVAALSGSGSISATLTAAGGSVSTPSPHGKWDGMLQPPRRRRVGAMGAELSGTAPLTAEITFTVNFDDQDFETLLLVGAI